MGTNVVSTFKISVLSLSAAIHSIVSLFNRFEKQDTSTSMYTKLTSNPLVKVSDPRPEPHMPGHGFPSSSDGGKPGPSGQAP